MALDPAVLAQEPAYPSRPVRVAPVPLVVPPLPDPDQLQEEANRKQLAYQAARQAVTERERWASLDRVTHQAQMALAAALELQLKLELQVKALGEVLAQFRRPAVLAPAALAAEAQALVTQQPEPVVVQVRPETVGYFHRVELPAAQAPSEPLPPVVPGALQETPVQQQEPLAPVVPQAPQVLPE